MWLPAACVQTCAHQVGKRICTMSAVATSYMLSGLRATDTPSPDKRFDVVSLCDFLLVYRVVTFDRIPLHLFMLA